MIDWVQRRGQIKHLLYELCLTGRIDRATFYEQITDLNNVTPIVRCRDCKWYAPARNILGGKRPEGRCDYEGVWVIESDYCSKGERGEREEDD